MTRRVRIDVRSPSLTPMGGDAASGGSESHHTAAACDPPERNRSAMETMRGATLPGRGSTTIALSQRSSSRMMPESSSGSVAPMRRTGSRPVSPSSESMCCTATQHGPTAMNPTISRSPGDGSASSLFSSSLRTVRSASTASIGRTERRRRSHASWSIRATWRFGNASSVSAERSSTVCAMMAAGRPVAFERRSAASTESRSDRTSHGSTVGIPTRLHTRRGHVAGTT